MKVSGKYACFTRPELKVERVSYDVITPSAARGIIETIHWKPAIRWYIDRIHVLKPIRFQSLRRNEVGGVASAGSIKSAMKSGDMSSLGIVVDEDRQQRASTILYDVAYIVEAHFDMTDRAGKEDNPQKHLDMFQRRARKGQCFHQPCLGTREFDAQFELIEPGTPLPEAIADTSDLGLMLWDIDHAAPSKSSIFFRAQMNEGIIDVPGPQSGSLYR